ncbi:uncharacterized protein LOC132557676 [Ylistrum balloti]|uniref:uncharacterized protein LOC132557676 n=1 Tax=Ylistrum balloti TaxID=509963 RepID=UPI0029058ECF|nr:uncharacterized protein LOC132557676 [Ylistrum balloti]
MAERTAFVKPGFRPYQKHQDDRPQSPNYPKQPTVTFRVLPNGEIQRDQSDAQQNREVASPSKPQIYQQDRDTREKRVMRAQGSEPKQDQSQRPAVYRVLADGTTIREQPDVQQNDRMYTQQTKAVEYEGREPARPLSNTSVGDRVLTNGKTHRALSNVPEDGRNFRQATLVTEGNNNTDPSKSHVFSYGRDNREKQHPKQAKKRDKDDPVDSPDKPKSSTSIVEGGIHKWAMFRLWVNREISQEVLKERLPSKEFKKRLELPMDSMVTSVLLDPASDTNGKRLQKEYGVRPNGNSFLPENIFFVFGIPRAKTSIDANVSEFIETMSNAVSRSEHDALSTKDDTEYNGSNIGSKNELGKSRKKGETNADERYKRWHANDLKKSRGINADGTEDKWKGWKEEQDSKAKETENLGKSRHWNSENYRMYQQHDIRKKLTETYRTWDDDDDRNTPIKGKGDISKSSMEEITDFAKYHVDDYAMPNKKRKDDQIEDLSKTAGENVYTTHVNK